MNHLYTEIAIMLVIVLYAVLVVVEMVIDEETRETVEFELWLLDLILLCLFALELGLKLCVLSRVCLSSVIPRCCCCFCCCCCWAV